MVLYLSNRLCCVWLLINMISRPLLTVTSFPPRNGRMLSPLPLLLQSLCSLVFLNKIAVKNFYSSPFSFLGTREQTTWGSGCHGSTKHILFRHRNHTSWPNNSLPKVLQTCNNMCQESQKLKLWPVYLTFAPIFPFKGQWNTCIFSDFMYRWMTCKWRLTSDSSRAESNYILVSQKFAFNYTFCILYMTY